MTSVQETHKGRPREFDVSEALEQAMLLFWRQGYSGTSLSDLTRAMGIAKTSMYAAFGNKEALFRLALQRYSEGPAAYAALALEEPTARGVAEAFLRGAVRATTWPGHPTGCLGVQASLVGGADDEKTRVELLAWREHSFERLRDRFERAVAEGDLPASARPDMLARYLTTIANGIAVQAVGGTSESDLNDVVDAALLGWPLA